MALDDILLEAEEKMMKTEEVVQHEFAGVRTGKASPGLVEINMTSLVRKTQSKVNCALVNPSQLNCTSDSGAQFSLSRRG